MLVELDSPRLASLDLFASKAVPFTSLHSHYYLSHTKRLGINPWIATSFLRRHIGHRKGHIDVKKWFYTNKMILSTKNVIFTLLGSTSKLFKHWTKPNIVKLRMRPKSHFLETCFFGITFKKCCNSWHIYPKTFLYQYLLTYL